jgi:outer membrane protein assembly factor BamA
MILLFILFLISPKNFEETYHISKINIDGNKNTQEYVIRREILFSEGDKVTTSEIQKNLKRIENLGIFNSVLYHLRKDSTAFILTYTVIERLNLIILPQVLVHADRGSKLSYGLKVKHSNLFGRNIFLNLDLLFGFRAGYRFSMSNPWFGGDNRYFYSFGYSKFENNNALNDDKLNDVTNLFCSFGRKFNPFESISFTTGYKSIEFNKDDISELSYSNQEVDKLLEYSLAYSYDTRDFYRNPKEGFRASISLNYLDYIVTDRVGNYGIAIDLRHYTTYGDFTFVNGIFNGNYLNDMIYYEQFTFGENSIIRSHNHKREFGNNLFIYRNEVRYNLFSNFKLSLNIPYFESYLQNMHISSYLYSFIDSGLLYEGISDFSYNNFKSSAGVGLAFMTPYLPYFTFEYGRNAIGYSSLKFSMKLYL